MASPHLLLHPHWVIINTLKTVCEHSYQKTNHFHAQPTQNTLTWTQEKASGEAEVPEYTDWESDCNCIQVHPILQVSRLSRDVRSSPLGGTHNLVSNQGQILSPSPQLVKYSFSLICLLISSRHRMEFSGMQIKSHPFGRRLLQEIRRPIFEDFYQSMRFQTVFMPFEVCFVCVWGFFTTQVHKTERLKRSNYKRTCDWHGVLLVEERCRTTHPDRRQQGDRVQVHHEF